jgi:Raf kinase inhibitor-like YbhB/YbcL family protein
MGLTLTTNAFERDGFIPKKHSKNGGNISPELSWSGVPKETRSLALIVDDPDAPSGTFVHWLLYGLPPGATGVKEGQPASETLEGGVRQGRNGFGELGYGGPQPPSGTHRYVFHIFALDTELALPPGASRAQLDKALRGHVIGEAQLVGMYKHQESSHAA